MKLVNVFTLSLAIFTTAQVCAQSEGEIFRTDNQFIWDIEVTGYGHDKSSAWGGGLNNPQFAQVDIDKDGNIDLVAFEQLGGIKTFINKGTPGNPKYVYAPNYEYLFPEVMGYLKLIDYNCDNVPDLFHNGGKGVVLCDGYYNNDGLWTTKNCREIKYYTGPFSGHTNIPVAPNDIPAIVDVDGDGNLDILSYVSWPEDQVTYYQNVRGIESLPCDSFKVKIRTNCWGKFKKNGITPEHTLAINCSDHNIPPMPPPGGDKRAQYKTTGVGDHCMTGVDFDEDKDIDLFDGEQPYDEIQYLVNGKNNIPNPVDSIVSEISQWSSNGKQVNIPKFPVAYWMDVDHDGLKDLLFAGHLQETENFKCVSYFKNMGSPGNPNFVYQSDSFIVDKMIDLGRYSQPLLYDYDKDGKLDLIVGSYGTYQGGNFRSTLSYFRNTSSGNKISFNLETDNLQNIAGHHIDGAAPAIGDINFDGRDDLLLGKADGTVTVFINLSGSASAPPQWSNPQTLNTKNNDPVRSKVGQHAVPFLYDLNKDGKKDLILGNSSGWLSYFENEAVTPGDIKLARVTDSLGKVFVGDTAHSGHVPPTIYHYSGYSAPFIGKMDNTGKEYLVVGNINGVLQRFEGVDKPYTPGMVYNRVDEMYSEIKVKGTHSVVAIGNVGGADADKYEMFIGNNLGGISVYRQWVNVNVKDVAAENRELKLYPNPASNKLMIAAPKDLDIESAEVTIHNNIGQRLTAKKLEANAGFITIDISNLPEGVYICGLTVKGSRYSSIFIKH